MPLDGAFSPLHWLIVAVVALLVLGPDKLPDAARKAGDAWREFRRVEQHLRSEFRDAVTTFDPSPDAREGATSSDLVDTPTDPEQPPRG